MKRLKKVFKSRTMRLAFRLMWDRKSITLALLACVLAGSLLAMVHPFAMQQFVDEGVAQKNKKVLVLSSPLERGNGSKRFSKLRMFLEKRRR